MNQIIQFFIRTKDFFVFLVLFVLSVSLVMRDNYYPQSIYLNSANVISGKMYEFSSYWGEYFGLRSKNALLAEENRTLRAKVLELEEKFHRAAETDSLTFGNDSIPYRVMKANVIRNSFRMDKNYFTINKGTRDGIGEDMGVISPQGVVGMISRTSGRFATVQSLLNTKSLINAMLKRTEHFGTLKWDTKHLNIVQLVEVPNIVPIHNGDTIVTGGQSQVFPKGIPIGRIVHYEKTPSGSSYIIDVKLFTDMSNLDDVYIIENKDRNEINKLENQDPQ